MGIKPLTVLDLLVEDGKGVMIVVLKEQSEIDFCRKLIFKSFFMKYPERINGA